MLTPTMPEFERNLGFLSLEEQHCINNSSVAIAGAGGDGGMLAVQLARLGVGELRLADPDPFEAENINRQACCTTETVGENKAAAVGKYISAVNPSIDVKIYESGITRENVEDFVAGSNLVIDETEFTMHSLGVMIARVARNEGIPNMMAMNIGFGATVTAFKPHDGMTFEKMLGLSEHASLTEIEHAEPSLSRWLPYIPSYGDFNVFKKVASGEKSAPSIAPGVAMAASLGTTQALLHLVQGQNSRPNPVYAPKVLVFDAMSGMSKQIRLTRRNHYASLMRMAMRNAMGLTPKSSY